MKETVIKKTLTELLEIIFGMLSDDVHSSQFLIF